MRRRSARKFDPRTLGCNCDACPLGAYKRERGSFAPVPPEGPEDAEYVLVGEHPGSQEEQYLRPFIGPSGTLLERTLNRLKIAREETLLTNAILCRPPDDLDAFNARYVSAANVEQRAADKHLPAKERRPRIPTPQEACRPHIETIAAAAAQRGAMMVALGKLGYWTIIGKKPKIMSVRGSFGEYVRVGSDKHGKPLLAEPTPETEHLFAGQPRLRVCASINPALSMREGMAPYREVLYRDLERAVRWHKGTLDWQDPLPKLVTDHPQARWLADWLRAPGPYTWDLETGAAYQDDTRKDLEDHYQDSRENKVRILGIYDVTREQYVCLPWVSIDGRKGFAPGQGRIAFPTPSAALRTAPPGLMPAPPSRTLAAPSAVDQTEAHRFGRQPWWLDFDDYHYTEGDGDIIVDALWRWFEDPAIWKVGHFSNYFDTGAMHRAVGPFRARAALDTILLSRVWNSELPRGLYFLGTMHTDVPAWKASKDDRQIARQPRSYRELVHYNLIDDYVEAKVVNALMPAAKAKWPVVELDHKVQAICLEMKNLGLWIHEETRAEVEEETRGKLVEEQRIVREVAGPDFNPRSVKQLSELLYDRWGYPIPMLTKSGKPSTSEDAIRVLLTTVGLLAEDHRVMLEALWRSRGWQKDLSDVILPMRRRSAGGIVHEDGVLRCDYTAHVPATGRISAGGPNCFDGETEILTESGWVRFDVLPKGLRVAQFWPADQTIDFVVPEQYVEAPFVGEMVQIKNAQTDLLVTPTHRLLVQNRRTNAWSDPEARDYPSDHRQYHAGTTRQVESWAISDDEIRFLVAMQADGTFRSAPIASGELVEYGVSFGFDKQRKKTRIVEILTRLGWAFSEHSNEASRPERTTFYLPYSENPQLRAFVHNTLTRDKVFGPWILRLSARQLRVFTNELWHWDGSFTRKSHYSSSDRRNADWAQIALVLAGRQRANLRAYNAPGLTKTNWQVDVSTKPYSNTDRARSWSQIPWSGTVYCVSVPSSYIIVRRCGKVCVIGQTQNWRKRLRRIVRPRPGHLFLMADYDQIELRLMSAVAQVTAYLAAFAAGEDPHAVTAMLVYGEVFRREMLIYKETGTKTERFTALRRFAKTFVYAVLYGGGASTVYENVAKAVDDDGNLLFPNMGFAQVEAAVKSWMRNAAEVPVWWAKTWRFAEEFGYVEEPILGRRRHMPEFLRNEAVNHGIQGGAAIIMGLGLVKLREAFAPDYAEGTGIVNQMHDAVTVEVPESRAMELAPIVTNALTCSFPDKLPNMVFSATAEIAIDWSEKHWRGPGDGKAQFGGVVKKTAQLVGKLKTPEAQAQVSDVLAILRDLQWARIQDQFALHKCEERVLAALKVDEKVR